VGVFVGADYRHISSPLSEWSLTPFENTIKGVKLHGVLTADEHVAVAKLMRQQGCLQLSAASVWGQGPEVGPTTLEFLAQYDFIEAFDCGIRTLRSFDGLDCLPDNLKMLSLGDFYSTKLVLLGLSRFTNLTNLKAIGVKFKEPDQIGELQHLKKSWINGGNVKSSDFLAGLAQLTHLGYGRISGVQTLDVLRSLVQLEALALWWMRHVTSLPSFENHNSLWSVTLHTMKGITDLSPIAAAPHLREVYITAPHSLQAPALKVLAGHKTLKVACVGYGSDRLGREFAAVLGPLGDKTIPLTGHDWS
jgi:hypothetical protein